MAKHVEATCCWQQAELALKCCEEMGLFRGMGKMGMHCGINLTFLDTFMILKKLKVKAKHICSKLVGGLLFNI